MRACAESKSPVYGQCTHYNRGVAESSSVIWLAVGPALQQRAQGTALFLLSKTIFETHYLTDERFLAFLIDNK